MGLENKHRPSPIEIQIIELLSLGLTEKEVAQRLHISVFTVDKYLRSVFTKYDLHNTTSVVAEALRRKDID